MHIDTSIRNNRCKEFVYVGIWAYMFLCIYNHIETLWQKPSQTIKVPNGLACARFHGESMTTCGKFPVLATQVKFQTNPKTSKNRSLFWAGKPIKTHLPPNHTKATFLRSIPKWYPQVVPNHVAKLPVQFDFEKKIESWNGNKYPVRHQVSFGSIFCTSKNQLVSGKKLQNQGKMLGIDVKYIFLSKDLWREKNMKISKSWNLGMSSKLTSLFKGRAGVILGIEHVLEHLNYRRTKTVWLPSCRVPPAGKRTKVKCGSYLSSGGFFIKERIYHKETECWDKSLTISRGSSYLSKKLQVQICNYMVFPPIWIKAITVGDHPEPCP